MTEYSVVILYGSQTGQGECIAENIHDAADEHDIKSKLICLRKAEEAYDIVTEAKTPVIFVCSTTGDGEPPGNARKFIRIIQRKILAKDHLSKLRYALLGLGDSNYSTFCGGPKTLERALKKVGARSFYQTGYADDGTDMEMVVEPWIEGLWPALKSHLKSVSDADVGLEYEATSEEINYISEDVDRKLVLSPIQNTRSAVPEEAADRDVSELSGALQMGSKPVLHDLLGDCDSDTALSPAMQPYLSSSFGGTNFDPSGHRFPVIPYPLAVGEEFYATTVRSATKMTTDDAVKTALCVTLDVPPEFHYVPGDSFGVVVPNPDLEVDWLIKRLKLNHVADKTLIFAIRADTKKKNAKVPSYIPTECSVRHVLKNCVEIRSVPKRTFLRVLLDHTTDESDRAVLHQLSSKEGMFDFVRHLREPNLNILDVLASLPSCQPPFEALVEHLPRLKARLYSAASCKQSSPGQLRFVFNVVDFDPTKGRMYPRKGLCTGTLQEMLMGGVTDSTGQNDTLPTTNGGGPAASHSVGGLIKLFSANNDSAHNGSTCNFTSSINGAGLASNGDATVTNGNLSAVPKVIDGSPELAVKSPADGDSGGTFVTSANGGSSAADTANGSSTLSTGADMIQDGAPANSLVIFPTKNNNFTLPVDASIPVIMVGPGTGVAPFIGFLEYLRYRRQTEDTSTEAWLFYGCRHKQRDHLFQREMQSFLDDGTLTHLVVAYSRDEQRPGSAGSQMPDGSKVAPKYVQHSLKLKGEEIRDLLLRRHATFYVCGDARHMAKDVKEAMIEIFSAEMDRDAASDVLKRLVMKGRYREDVWT